jgi:hypothetical protein
MSKVVHGSKNVVISLLIVFSFNFLKHLKVVHFSCIGLTNYTVNLFVLIRCILGSEN